MFAPRCFSRLVSSQGFRRALYSSSAAPEYKSLSALEADHLAERLRKVVGEGNVSLAQAVRSQHGQDEGPDKGELPDIVVFAENTGHVSEASRSLKGVARPPRPWQTIG